MVLASLATRPRARGCLVPFNTNMTLRHAPAGSPEEKRTTYTTPAFCGNTAPTPAPRACPHYFLAAYRTATHLAPLCAARAAGARACYMDGVSDKQCRLVAACASAASAQAAIRWWLTEQKRTLAAHYSWRASDVRLEEGQPSYLHATHTHSGSWFLETCGARQEHTYTAWVHGQETASPAVLTPPTSPSGSASCQGHDCHGTHHATSCAAAVSFHPPTLYNLCLLRLCHAYDSIPYGLSMCI